MRASRSSKRIIPVILLMSLNGCAVSHPGIRSSLDQMRDPDRLEGQMAGWWAEHRSGKSNPIHEELDRVLFCSYGPCVQYARAHGPVVEEAIRSQITKSLTRELAAAAVNDRVTEYRATAVEYAALRTVSALNYPSVDEVAVEARRLLLDLRLFRDAGEDLAAESLLAPTVIAAMTVKQRYPDLYGQLRREINTLPGSAKVAPLLDGLSTGEVPVVFLSGLVPVPEEEEEIVELPTGDMKSIRVKVVSPALPAVGSIARTCSIRTSTGVTSMSPVTDNYALSEIAMERRSADAKQRSALRSTAKSLAASKVAEEASKETVNLGVDLAANASSAEGAAVALAAAGWAAGAIGGLFQKATQWTEKADVRSASLVPRAIFVGRISAHDAGKAMRVECSGSPAVQIASGNAVDGAPVGLFRIAGPDGKKTFSGRIGSGN